MTTVTMADKTHYDDVPGEKVTSGTLVARDKWDDFQAELKAREGDFRAMLPPHIRPQRFIAASLAAAKQTPDLIFADKRTLFSALTKAAQDGLLPDGREGIITIYNTNIAKRGQPDKWIKAAQWNPMVYGLRKRARELGDIIIDAQVVYENDKFIWHQGDDPRIEHTPAPLGTSRGKMIGVYAIFKQGSAILHREVMAADQVLATRNQSKAKDSLMWTTFETEGWRKAVIRRGIKTVPVSEDFENIVRREDENFEFEGKVEAVRVLTPPPAPKPKLASSSQPNPEQPFDAPTLPDGWQDYLDRQYSEFLDAKTAAAKQGVCDAVTDNITAARERGELSGEEAELIAENWNSALEKAG